MYTYKSLIAQSELAEYIGEYQLAIDKINEALKMKQSGSITKNSLIERKEEMQKLIKP